VPHPAPANATGSAATAESTPVNPPPLVNDRSRRPNPREESAARAARVTAQQARATAQSAGASDVDLEPGDAELHAADQLIGSGRPGEAVPRLLQASSFWSQAERTARARAAAQPVTKPTEPAASAPPPTQ